MKTFFAFLLLLLASSVCNAQISIYIRLLDYNNNNIYNSTATFPADPKAIPTPGSITHADEALIATYADGDRQTLNIGSQSSGAGAGKVTFDSLTFSKLPDAQSPNFFSLMASGTSFKFVEFSFYKGSTNQFLFYKVRLSLAAFSGIQRTSATCSTTCPDLVENYTMDYGAKYIVYYSQKPDGSYATPVGAGWDRVHNISWNGVTAIQ